MTATKHNNMTENDWIATAVRFCSGNTPNHKVWKLGCKAFETKSCLIHAAHLIMIEDAPHCTLCSGVLPGPVDHPKHAKVDGKPVHELCRLRKERGLEIRRLPDPECLCRKCQP